jgi:hypothetical protein
VSPRRQKVSRRKKIRRSTHARARPTISKTRKLAPPLRQQSRYGKQCRCFKIHEAGAAGQPRQPVHPVCPSKAGANSRNMARTAEENPHPPRGRHDGSRRRDRGGIEFLRSA